MARLPPHFVGRCRVRGIAVDDALDVLEAPFLDGTMDAFRRVAVGVKRTPHGPRWLVVVYAEGVGEKIPVTAWWGRVNPLRRRFGLRLG